MSITDNQRKIVFEVILFIYIFTVLWFTVFNRAVRFSPAQLELFWSYKAWLNGDTGLGLEILANMAMFVPLGFLLSYLLCVDKLRKRCVVFVILAAILFSLIIESFQLFLMRGLFEWDDVISNTIGAVVGVCLFKVINLLPVVKQRIITATVSSVFMLICLVVSIRWNGKVGVEADNTSRAYCFQVENVEYTDREIELSGFSFRYENPKSDYTLFLRSKNGKWIKLEKETVPRYDVDVYFSCEYDYSSSGFTARGTVEEGEYEVIIQWPWSIALPTGVFVSSSGVHYVIDEFTAPEIDAEFVKKGILRLYRPDVHCWVYQYQGSLYWIVDQGFYFEDDGSTYIQYQLWTTQTQNLPAKRLENGWLWDNIGGYFEDYEIHSDWNGYRVMKRDLPTAYSVSSIVTGYYKNGEWIWKEYFRPYYEFTDCNLSR